MNQFNFLQPEFPEVHEAAHRAEALAISDPRASCFYARRALELAVTWAYENDGSLQVPYRDDLSALIHEPTFKNLVGEAVFYKCRAIKNLGNHAVHSQKPITKADSTAALRELFHFCYWLARTYSRGERPAPSLSFDPNALPDSTVVAKQTLDQLQRMSADLAQEREKTLAVLAGRESLDEQLRKAREQIEAIKKANKATPDSHDYSEAETRDLFIDLLLKEAGWQLNKPEDREYEVAGMPNAQQKGFVDYVLWGDDGKPLGIVEAKKTRRDPQQGQQQAKLYADCLETAFGQRPIIFYTNGYEHWIWDDTFYPPRAIQGFYKMAELELLIQRRQTRKSLASATVNKQIVERYYQERAIRRIAETFEHDRSRRALLVMATGAGKTRTVIALAEMLMKANWAKRVLFLADRTALVNQAAAAFKRFLPDASPVNLLNEKSAEGRVYVSTYQTMIPLIDETRDKQRRFGVGHFDLVIIDEAHRSIFMKYGAIFEYFDSLLVGLTATPKDEVARNTYRLFELEDGVPTDAYSLEQAVSDNFLVPARSVSVGLKLPREGIIYDQLSDAEKEAFEATDWKERTDEVLESGKVEGSAINQWLFNADTVDKVLKHLMERGLKVDAGDKLGKTIIFAKNHAHAMFIADRFNKNYPKYAGQFARVIDFKVEYAQSLIDDFSNLDRLPQIAISVDMLDTGIDVPEIVNLVFFKQVRSRTKFWQMVGRGTRLCPNLFGPGKHKEFFYIFDYCGNLEFFSQNLPNSEGSSGASLSHKLFTSRLKLAEAISSAPPGTTEVKEPAAGYGSELKTNEDVRKAILEILQSEVAAMNTDNFIVRTRRQKVEKYQNAEEWNALDQAKFSEIAELAGLPTEKALEPVVSKQFDLLMLQLQLSTLQGSKRYEKQKKQLQVIASILQESDKIPVIKQQIELIQELQTEPWWEDVTLAMLENVRLRLRGLVPLIDPAKSSIVHSDFTDEIGDETEVDFDDFGKIDNFDRFKEKARAFLLKHLDREAIQKLRMNEPLGPDDLNELERILKESEAGSNSSIERAGELGFGLFVRSLVGLDREAAKRALSTYLSETQLSGNQIEFVNMVIDYLTEHGVMEPKALYESPFTDIHQRGPSGIFDPPTVTALIDFLTMVRERASSFN